MGQCTARERHDDQGLFEIIIVILLLSVSFPLIVVYFEDLK